MLKFRYVQPGFLAVILCSWLAIFGLTRSLLLVHCWAAAEIGVGSLLYVYALGLVYDLVFLAYAALPLLLYSLLCPARWWQSRWHRWFLMGLTAASLFVMSFVAVAEWLFWEEFGARFNFIAVDYLIYSKEVVDNILESYPVYPLLAVLAATALTIVFAFRRRLWELYGLPVLPRKAVAGSLAILAGLAMLATVCVDQDFPRGTEGNLLQRELAGNGPFQFFAAFRHNELDYRHFYSTLDDSRLSRLLHNEVYERNARPLTDDPLDLRRFIHHPGPEHRYNVILVTVESLSAKYLGSFGDARGLTPHLDRLRQDSLFFSDFYATGTRTDRGLEAITLSIPPTPGRSIVKRLGRESGYASLGQQLVARGYDSVFVYGGRGYFDNMNAFFSGNGYRVVDQTSAAADAIRFTNAWGMSDEDLYDRTIGLADDDHARGKPFFLQLMTTSNHRPYTYPDGRIDIPSGQGREGAVKYTDYAIGRFLDKAREKPWFGETLFVFVADHTAGSAGREDLPVANYHIPLFIYAPGIVAPREITTLASQIDLAPTLLGLLGFDYESTFFGRDLLREDAGPGRALIGNYQHLGLFDGENLAILSPKKHMRRHDHALGAMHEYPANSDDPLLQRAIAYYQGANYAFQEGLLAWRGGIRNDERTASR